MSSTHMISVPQSPDFYCGKPEMDVMGNDIEGAKYCDVLTFFDWDCYLNPPQFDGPSTLSLEDLSSALSPQISDQEIPASVEVKDGGPTFLRTEERIPILASSEPSEAAAQLKDVDAVEPIQSVSPRVCQLSLNHDRTGKQGSGVGRRKLPCRPQDGNHIHPEIGSRTGCSTSWDKSRSSGVKKASRRQPRRAAGNVFKKYVSDDSLWMSETLGSIDRAISTNMQQGECLIEMQVKMDQMVDDNINLTSHLTALKEYIQECGADARAVSSKLAGRLRLPA